jgi:hypothetical protein
VEEEILDFIKRRFSSDCNWMSGNCFYFAQILASRFNGDIVYEPIEGHFLFWGSDDKFYDWTGIRNYTREERRKMFLWRFASDKDPLLYNRIYRDCIK